MLVLALAALTVNRYAPSAFSGDVILYSVMSLQNVTLFFWEQNRLLNVGPALTAVVRDPTANFIANLMFPAVVFFVLLRYLAGRAVRVAANSAQADRLLGERAVFLLLVLVVFLVLRPAAIFDYVIWHVEYSLSWLLLAIAYFRWFAYDSVRIGGLLMVMVFMVVATGVNYSIVLPALALSCGRVWITGSVSRDTVKFALVAVGAIMFWVVVARFFPGPGQEAYAGFDILGLGDAIPQVLRNVSSVLFLPGLALVVGAVIVLRFGRAGYLEPAGLGLVQVILTLFALGWLVLFAGNAWVAANQYHFRYFAPVLFVGLMLLALDLAHLRVPLSAKGRLLACVALFLGLAAYLSRPFVPLQEYEFVRRADAVAVEGVAIYGGDFNLTWAAVMRGLLRGEAALGLAERASGNEAALLEHADAALAADGVLVVNCLQAAALRCLDQANAYVGPLRLREVTGNVEAASQQLLTLEPATPDALVYRGAALTALPGEVGVRDGQAVRSSGERGFLVYGPYRALAAGDYRVRVFGATVQPDGAWVDVVSQGARNRHMRLPLSPTSEKNEGVLAEGALRFDAPARGVEVRVFVNRADRLVLTGYEVVPEGAGRAVRP